MNPYRVTPGDIDGVLIVGVNRFVDHRGWTGEVFNEDAFSALGVTAHFVQDNHSLSARAGTVRGLHHQTGPAAQAKLVRCVRGAIFNVGVDLRRNSPSFGRCDTRVLTPSEGEWIYLPIGFTHGFAALEDDTEVHFKVSAGFSADHRAGLYWNDPDIAIPWPEAARAAPVVSAADQALATWRALEDSDAFFD